MNELGKLSPRQIEIFQHARRNGRVLVESLVEMFGTTPQTIRKDLQALADANKVMRFHGGAALLAGVEYTDFEARKHMAAKEKDIIGKAVAQLIPNNIVLMLNIGTTTAAVAQQLKHHAGLKIITDNVNIANDLRTFTGINVMVPGGSVRHSDGAIIGEAAVEFLSQFRADIAVIGTAAIGGDGTLYDYDLREAHVARAIIQNSRHVILAADHTKFDGSAPVQIGHLSQVDKLVTDEFENSAMLELCEKHGVELVKA
ncbi:DeoR family transcriptional regulator [Rhodobacterales bacterium 52_120_T64]|nr:DeoR family transcriptional regulator [Rhodobacterales bacterium 52_120_T64]